MALTAPLQQRSIDPYSNRRFSSILNRLTRIVTNGQDMILFPNQSFTLTFVNYKTVIVGAGICVKDDVIIHTTESFTIDFSNNDYYVDTSGTMSQGGYYYIVLSYNYSRSLPAPAAYIKVIRNIGTEGLLDGLYYGHESSYIFLGSATVAWVAAQGRYEVTAVNYNTPRLRPVATGSWITIDGGEL